METRFLIIVLGTPLLILLVAVLGAHFYRGSEAELLDWKLTRSPETEVKLELSDIDQMLAAQNRLRRERGAPERSLEEITERSWRKLDRQ
jgi:hypothetical protein